MRELELQLINNIIPNLYVYKQKSLNMKNTERYETPEPSKSGKVLLMSEPKITPN